MCLIVAERQQAVNGHSRRLAPKKRARHRDSGRATSQSPDREEGKENPGRRFLKRRIAQVAVNKIKLLEASLSEEEEDDYEEDNPRRSSGRLRSSRRAAVIQSSSESEGPSAHGTLPRPSGRSQRPRCTCCFNRFFIIDYMILL